MSACLKTTSEPLSQTTSQSDAQGDQPLVVGSLSGTGNGVPYSGGGDWAANVHYTLDPLCRFDNYYWTRSGSYTFLTAAVSCAAQNLATPADWTDYQGRFFPQISLQGADIFVSTGPALVPAAMGTIAIAPAMTAPSFGAPVLWCQAQDIEVLGQKSYSDGKFTIEVRPEDLAGQSGTNPDAYIKVDPFEATMKSQSGKVSFSAPGFALVVDLSKRSADGYQFQARLDLSINGVLNSKTIDCAAVEAAF